MTDLAGLLGALRSGVKGTPSRGEMIEVLAEAVERIGALEAALGPVKLKPGQPFGAVVDAAPFLDRLDEIQSLALDEFVDALTAGDELRARRVEDRCPSMAWFFEAARRARAAFEGRRTRRDRPGRGGRERPGLADEFRARVENALRAYCGYAREEASPLVARHALLLEQDRAREISPLYTAWEIQRREAAAGRRP